MQFEDIIFGVIAKLRNMDHPFIDEWEIEDNCCRMSQVLDELRERRPRVEVTTAAAPTADEPPSLPQHHQLLLELQCPTNHQQLKKTPPAANNALPLPASATYTTDAADCGEQAMMSERVEVETENDGVFGVPAVDEVIAEVGELLDAALLDEVIAAAGELLDAEAAILAAGELLNAGLDLEIEQQAGLEDTTSLTEEARRFAESYVPLGGTPDPTTEAATDTQPSFALPPARNQPPDHRPGHQPNRDQDKTLTVCGRAPAPPTAPSLAPDTTMPTVSPDFFRSPTVELTLPVITPPRRPPPELDRGREWLGEYAGARRVPRHAVACQLEGCLGVPTQRVPGTTISIATGRVC